MTPDELIVHIAATCGITVIDCRVTEHHLVADMPREIFDRDSYLIGADEIILGRYDGEDDVRIAAFLHEVGHVYDVELKRLGRLAGERAAWRTARGLAAKYGVAWSDKADEYERRCLTAYQISSKRKVP